MKRSRYKVHAAAELRPGVVTTATIADSSVTTAKIASGNIVDWHIKYLSGTTDPVPDADTEAIVHNLGYEPDFVSVSPTTAGVEGYVMIANVTASSVVLKASVSGVVARYVIVGR